MADRLQVRVAPETKKRLEQAALTEGVTVSAFVLRAAQAQADSVLAERSGVRLTDQEAEALLTALARPGRVGDRLRETLTTQPKFAWID
ncbi:MAG: DUF1778 domain-containing protein [Bifidobacteriaceae bacterium]|nr:DUF1778 domain-containing protein [Bifidobacteriaceae bacterium]